MAAIAAAEGKVGYNASPKRTASGTRRKIPSRSGGMEVSPRKRAAAGQLRPSAAATDCRAGAAAASAGAAVANRAGGAAARRSSGYGLVSIAATTLPKSLNALASSTSWSAPMAEGLLKRMSRTTARAPPFLRKDNAAP